MEIKNYRAPQAKVVELYVQGVLCQSGDTEKFTLGDNRYGEDDWN